MLPDKLNFYTFFFLQFLHHIYLVNIRIFSFTLLAPLIKYLKIQCLQYLVHEKKTNVFHSLQSLSVGKYSLLCPMFHHLFLCLYAFAFFSFSHFSEALKGKRIANNGNKRTNKQKKKTCQHNKSHTRTTVKINNFSWAAQSR